MEGDGMVFVWLGI